MNLSDDEHPLPRLGRPNRGGQPGNFNEQTTQQMADAVQEMHDALAAEARQQLTAEQQRELRRRAANEDRTAQLLVAQMQQQPVVQRLQVGRRRDRDPEDEELQQIYRAGERARRDIEEQQRLEAQRAQDRRNALRDNKKLINNIKAAVQASVGPRTAKAVMDAVLDDISYTGAIAIPYGWTGNLIAAVNDYMSANHAQLKEEAKRHIRHVAASIVDHSTQATGNFDDDDDDEIITAHPRAGALAPTRPSTPVTNINDPWRRRMREIENEIAQARWSTETAIAEYKYGVGSIRGDLDEAQTVIARNNEKIARLLQEMHHMRQSGTSASGNFGCRYELKPYMRSGASGNFDPAAPEGAGAGKGDVVFYLPHGAKAGAAPAYAEDTERSEYRIRRQELYDLKEREKALEREWDSMVSRYGRPSDQARAAYTRMWTFIDNVWRPKLRAFYQKYGEWVHYPQPRSKTILLNPWMDFVDYTPQ